MNNSITITVPSTNHASKISKSDFESRLNSVLEVGSQLLGGATAIKAKGSYYSEELGRTIFEDVYNVKMFGTRADIKSRLAEFSQCLKFWASDWKQEGLAVEVNGSLYFVTKENGLNIEL